MDTTLFHKLTREQKQCEHHFVEVKSAYDPHMPANIACVHCGARLVDVQRHEHKQQQKKQDRQEEPHVDAELEERTLLVWDIENRAKQRVLALGGNIMYAPMRHFEYGVLLPLGTTREGQYYILSSGDVLRLTPRTHGDVDGDRLVFNAVATALRKSPNIKKYKVVSYGTVGRRASESSFDEESGRSNE